MWKLTYTRHSRSVVGIHSQHVTHHLSAATAQDRELAYEEAMKQLQKEREENFGTIAAPELVWSEKL